MFVDHVEHLKGGELTVTVWRGVEGRPAPAPAEGRMNRLDKIMNHAPLFAEARGDIAVSFEFFPPKTEKMAETLWESVQTLAPLQPRFVSVTYGAGGSTRERTHQTVERILKETSLTPAAHLTCVAASRDEIDEIARDYWELGVRNIVALRGDAPEAGTKYQPHPQGYRDAAELVEGLKKVAPFDISVAAYPEVHPDSCDRAFDLENLKRKVDAGADRCDHAVLLLGRLLLPFPRRSRGGRNRRRDRSGHPAGLERRDDPPLRCQLRRGDPQVAGRSVRGPRRPSGRAPADRRDRRRRALRAALRGRRSPLPLLHFEPGGAFLRDLPPARREGASMSASQTLRAEAAKRILIKDGPYGTGIQAEKLSADAYCAGLDLMKDQKGNNDLLNITQPQVVRSICERFADAGAEILATNTFNANRISQADYARRASGCRHQPRIGSHHPRGRRPLHARRTASRAGSRERSARPTRPCRCRRTSTTPPIARSISTR